MYLYVAYTKSVRKRRAHLKLQKKDNRSLEVGIGGKKMTNNNYELNKAYTEEAFKSLNYQPKVSEVVLRKLMAPKEFLGQRLGDMSHNEFQNVIIIKSKDELVYELMYQEVDSFVSGFEKRVFGNQIINKYHGDLLVGQNLVSFAGALVIRFLLEVEHGLGSTNGTYDDFYGNTVLLDIKNYPTDDKTISEIYEKMIPYVKVYNLERRNGVQFETAFELMNKAFTKYVDQINFENQLKKQLSEL